MSATRLSHWGLVVPVLISAMIGSLSAGDRALAAASEVLPIPELALWETHMKHYGKKHCARMVQVLFQHDFLVESIRTSLGTVMFTLFDMVCVKLIKRIRIFIPFFLYHLPILRMAELTNHF